MRTRRKVVIVGAGGHGKVVADIVVCAGDEVIGFLDDQKSKKDILGSPVLGTVKEWTQFAQKAYFVLAIGSNCIRERLTAAIAGPWYTAVHPSAQIGAGVRIASGSVVMAGALINAEAQIGSHCIVNTGAVIEHDTVLEDFVHIAPNATLCGTVRIGHGTHVGAGSVVKNNCTVCPNCILGAGAVVVRDITEPGTYVGVPAGRIS